MSNPNEASVGGTEPFDLAQFVVQRLDRIETRMDRLETRIDDGLGQVRHEVGQVRTEMGQLRDRLDNLRLWTFGTIVTIVVGFAVVVVTLVGRG